MGKIILGVIAGFIVWSFIWVGTDALLTVFSPNWYGKNIVEFQKAAENGQPFKTETLMAIFALCLSIICSLMAGFSAVLIAKENFISTLILGVLLLLVGLLVAIAYWNYFPLWYHFLFLILLIPMTISGGKLNAKVEN